MLAAGAAYLVFTALHPQAQLELSDLLRGLTGQAVVSTHSAHLVTAVDPRSIRLVRRTVEGLRVTDFNPVEGSLIRARHAVFHREEMEKLKRMVERPFGELLFASIVVVGDGATERALLPVLIRQCSALRRPECPWSIPAA